MGKKQPETFGERLRRLRARAGLSQPDLAERSGISLGTIRTWEQRSREPLASSLPPLIRSLGCTAAEMLGMEPEQHGNKGRHERESETDNGS